MKSPLQAGSPIDAKRCQRWFDQYGSYRSGVTKLGIESWIDQFEASDRDLAARLLDAVEYYDHGKITTAFRHALNSLDGWDKTETKRKGRWRFAAMSGSAGESGDSMLYQFRVANGLDPKPMNHLFVSRSELFRLPLLPESDPRKIGQDDVVVLLDDFSGTGSQVCDAWNDPETSFGALLSGVGRVYLIVVAASKAARIRIAKETSISVMPGHELQDSDNIFSQSCKAFADADKASLLRYCQIADKKHPKGFGESGLVVVFQHRIPNNSIPILHAVHNKWIGLFPRHE